MVNVTNTIGVVSVAFAAALFASASASATTVNFTNITGTWFGAVLLAPGTPVEVYTGNGTNNAQVRWGVSTGQGRSGYDFVAPALASTTVTVPGQSPALLVGTFRHVNFPVFAPSISSIKLGFSADVDIDGTGVGNKTFVWLFGHDETTNNLVPCPYGGANGQGVNINGCADRVNTNFNGTSDFFNIAGVNYTLDIRGFLVNNAPTTQFLTTEGVVNDAQIIAQVRTLAGAVPEPASWAMMITGFGLVGAAVRRRRAQVSVSA